MDSFWPSVVISTRLDSCTALMYKVPLLCKVLRFIFGFGGFFKYFILCLISILIEHINRVQYDISTCTYIMDRSFDFSYFIYSHSDL
jgi:hypothetical protein